MVSPSSHCSHRPLGIRVWEEGLQIYVLNKLFCVDLTECGSVVCVCHGAFSLVLVAGLQSGAAWSARAMDGWITQQVSRHSVPHCTVGAWRFWACPLPVASCGGSGGEGWYMDGCEAL